MKVPIGLIAIVLLLLGSIKAKAIVGYYNQIFTPGNNLFAIAMLGGSNTVSQLFPGTAPEGTTISLYNPATTNFDTSSTFSGGSWSTNLSLPPGIGAQLDTPRAFTNTFVGTVLNHDGSPYHGDPIPLPPVFSGTNGVYLLGDKTMIINVGTNIFLNIIGRMPYVGEQVIRLSGSSTYLGNGMWDLIPTLKEGEAAFFFSTNDPPPNDPSSFLNLDFESCIITSSQPAWWFGGNTGMANMPGWTEFNGWSDSNYSGGASVIYNNQTLDSPNVSLWDANYPNPAIQGKFSVFLYGGSSAYAQAYPGWPTGASIFQAGKIPITAKSMSYWGPGYNGLQVTFNGQLLTFINTSNAANHSVWTADISAYAGQTGQLEFAVLWQGGAILDNIQFSSSPILEPPPKLSIVCNNNQAIVSWPSATSIWILQTNTSLTIGGWGNYIGLINNNTVTNSISGQNLFFRLLHQ